MIAVEPGADLAAILAATHASDRLDVRISDFETAGLPSGFNLVVAATALHWLDPVTAVERIAGLVRPGGWLAAWAEHNLG